MRRGGIDLIAVVPLVLKRVAKIAGQVPVDAGTQAAFDAAPDLGRTAAVVEIDIGYARIQLPGAPAEAPLGVVIAAHIERIVRAVLAEVVRGDFTFAQIVAAILAGQEIGNLQITAVEHVAAVVDLDGRLGREHSLGNAGNRGHVVENGPGIFRLKRERAKDVKRLETEHGRGIAIDVAGVDHRGLNAAERSAGVGATLVSLYFSQKMLFVPNTLAVMASVQKSKSDEIEIKLNTAYDMCPFWLIPPRAPKRSFTNGSRLMIESGMQPKGIAQGQTPQLIHISEIGIIPNPHNVIQEGLLPATHSNKNLFMVFEGTGSGNVGWFPDFWRSQKEKWPLRTGRMCPLFIPWHLATDMYPHGRLDTSASCPCWFL